MPRESEPSERIIAAIDRLAHEVRTLRETIEEFRVSFEWAVQNDRLSCGGEPSERWVVMRPTSEAIVEPLSASTDKPPTEHVAEKSRTLKETGSVSQPTLFPDI